MRVVVKAMNCLDEVSKEECIEGNSRRPRTESWGTQNLTRRLVE